MTGISVCDTVLFIIFMSVLMSPVLWYTDAVFFTYADLIIPSLVAFFLGIVMALASKAVYLLLSSQAERLELFKY